MAPAVQTLRVMRGHEISQKTVERIIIYGRAGIGKTRFGLSLTERFGKIAYYAADKNSYLLDSISRKKRERVIVFNPENVVNPTAMFMEFCMTNFSAVDPEIKTLVVDTYTKVAMDAITYSANSGSMDREKHYIIGIPGKGGQAIPNRGDYQAVDSLSKGFLDMLFDKQKDMHIIFLCHEDVKIIENVHAIGGPAHPGRAMTEYLPAQFSTVLRVIREQILVPGEESPRDVVVAIGEGDGKFISKVKTENETGPNPLARVSLEQDPTSYWKKYDTVYHFNKESE